MSWFKMVIKDWNWKNSLQTIRIAEWISIKKNISRSNKKCQKQKKKI